MWAEPRNHGYLLREVERRLGSQLPVSNSRTQQGRGDVAGLPGDVLAFRGDLLWAHTSLTMEPGRNKGRSPEKAAEASSSGSAEGTMALSFLCHHLHASSSLPCRVALYTRTPRRSQPQEMWSGAGPGKGANCPRTGRRGQRSRGGSRGPRPRLSTAASAWPAQGTPTPGEVNALPLVPPSSSVWTTWLTPHLTYFHLPMMAQPMNRTLEPCAWLDDAQPG